MRKNLLCTFALLSSIFFSVISRAQSAPTISYTNPVNGPVGTSVKIVGNNFGSTQSSSTIAFNGTTATPTSWSNTQIVAPVPTGATTGPILVTVGGVASNHVNFTVGTPPTISYTNPVNGPAGTSVTIVGTYFGSIQDSSTLTFNGTSATPTSWSSTQIVTPVPSGATTGPVVATVGGVVSNHVNFTVGTPPTISYTNPIDGPAGTTVTIAGNYFGSTQGSSTITFNGTTATPTSWSNTQIVTAVPTSAATGPVVVTVGSLASNHVNFIVGTPPTISYTNPIDGAVSTSITIVGNYFGSAVGNVTFNGTAATPASWSNTQIVVPVPSGASTGPVVVTAGGNGQQQCELHRRHSSHDLLHESRARCRGIVNHHNWELLWNYTGKQHDHLQWHSRHYLELGQHTNHCPDPYWFQHRAVTRRGRRNEQQQCELHRCSEHHQLVTILGAGRLNRVHHRDDLWPSPRLRHRNLQRHSSLSQ